ncbi:hypothetical protein MKY34_14115 [Sporosarcina sp. FSL K6-1522]|uniref:hypothetical protein n=1 Tax=Sporosarcina sp. FSL K6-1522 TaxID=2921554 RepID=UPI00315AAEBE
MHYFHPLWIAGESSSSVRTNASVQSQTNSRSESPFPSVNTQQLHTSAEKMLDITKQAQFVINRIVDSQSFAYELMDASQLSNQKKVDELIKSTGVTSKVKTKFTPSGIHIEFDNAEKLGDCCKLQISLRW